MAKAFGVVDPQAVKSEAKTETSQPVFLQIQEQWETWIQHLIDLPPRHALVKIRGKPARQIVTPTVPRPKVHSHAVEHIKALYRRRLMKKKRDIVLPHRLPKAIPATVSRTVFVSSSRKAFELTRSLNFG